MPVCARVYIYIYILPSVSCHFPRLGTRFIVRMPRLDRHVSRGGEDPKVASPAVSWFFLGFQHSKLLAKKKKSDRPNIIELDER